MQGFTLIELIIVIVLMSAVGILVGQLFSQPFTQYQAASRRAELSSLANAALNRMSSDINNAVPNSVRVIEDNSGGTRVVRLEFLLIAAGGRYRYVEDANQSELDALSPAHLDSQFNSLGDIDLNSIPAGHQLVVNPFNTQALYSAASGAGSSIGIITPNSTTFSLNKSAAINEDGITLSAPFQFDYVGTGSTRNRFYFTSTPVSYRCSQTTGQLTRFTNYSVAGTLTSNAPTGAGVNSALVLNNIANCRFLYESGISQRLGLVTLQLSVASEAESVNLVKQVRFYNVP